MFSRVVELPRQAVNHTNPTKEACRSQRRLVVPGAGFEPARRIPLRDYVSVGGRPGGLLFFFLGRPSFSGIRVASRQSLANPGLLCM